MDYTVFLDRDGVINKDSDAYIKNADEFEFIPQSPEAIALLCRHGFNVMVITNQSMIGRKMADSGELDAIFQKMNRGVEKAGGRIRDIFFCPHTPDDHCGCRKPAPGLILSARKKYGIDPRHTCMIGDSAKDIECGRNAGCGKTVLVKTGNGIKAQQQLSKKGITPDFISSNLYEAVQWVINNTDDPD